jgi:hypothetical protein
VLVDQKLCRQQEIGLKLSNQKRVMVRIRDVARLRMPQKPSSGLLLEAGRERLGTFTPVKESIEQSRFI